jgi:hypothetical protein
VADHVATDATQAELVFDRACDDALAGAGQTDQSDHYRSDCRFLVSG